MRVGWGITGSGHYLFDTFDVMERVSEHFELSCYLSSAGERVVRIYGLWDRLNEICPGGYYREIVLGSEQGASSPLAGRFQRGRYQVLVVSPASTNTVAKAVRGIADTLVTNAFSHARKENVPIFVIPTDKREKEVSKLPYIINREVCREELGKSHEKCEILTVCPYEAIVEKDEFPTIDLTKCEGCGTCLESCSYGAVSFGKNIETKVGEIDLENLERLKRIDSVKLLDSPKDLLEELKKVEKSKEI
ncbi:hypothetical protein AKJ62_04565 [candidate division MSBL1 archaeon SCGC-AAA259D14]|uniref:4Fe-4S ferredoxin-type domain-containing protein n=5 Tax=candidate division MSBL1 TaxID=215777 RepID=A0A133USJ4_9EURY|nr:hypothetical protein AKJ62_04565 [candidate division MSBL1 archaeon SCGC-AAA259D14]KXA92944.1 hypothetical protein AKJ66_03165 [candidate division MSBL1 archaeon SCGC-AAA259E22]KXA95185.1 hypothetical protein AKJ36_01290 [candidate division MSBL1 archaeon SCGC-AAA259I07]KXA97117.1 hypothetical protein AKJ38_01935 [candidate division MSBL1 archaeon SCGC-AAA259I14]KXA98383.1 hypothetical protein AKJ39_02170 [candidate division MSBL1 archaeon SCGC-AAA259J03]